MAASVNSVTVGAPGWYSEAVIGDLAPGGTYDTGFGANNDPDAGTPKVAFTVVRKSVDDTGAASTITDTIYGTKAVRKHFPNEAANEESGSAPVTIRFALSDYIYAKDKTGGGNSGTDPVVSILGGFYTQAATPNVASGAGFAVTNNSTQAYPRPVCNWAWPDRDVITSNTLTLRVVAFGRHARNGRPVRCIKFTATDEHSNTATVTVTQASIDLTVGDAVPVVEYIANIDVSSFTNGDIVTCQFQAYDWVGDTPLDTSDGVNTNPSPNYAPQKWLLDRTGAYGGSEAFVDPVLGTAGGAAVARGAGVEGVTAPFQTIYQAVNAIILRNEAQYSRKSSDHSFVYLADGSYAFIGAGSLPGALVAQKTYLTIKKAPSATRANVIINSQAGANTVQQYLKFENVTLGNTAAASFCTGHTMVWCDRVFFNQTTANRLVLTNNTLQYVTRSVCTNYTEGFIPFGAVTASYALFRGNDFTSYAGQIQLTNFIGNKRDHGAGTLQRPFFTTKTNTSLNPLPQTPIFAFNKFLTLSSSGGNTTSVYTVEADAPAGYVGTAFVQNLLEQCHASGSPVIAIAADSSDNECNNVIIWHNTSLGQRNNNSYNDIGSRADARKVWSMKNNIVDDWNIKADLFSNPINTLTRVGTLATATVTGGHNYVTGDVITVSGANQANYNGVFTITVTAPTTFEYTMAADPGASGTGTIITRSHQGRNGGWPQLYGVGDSGNVLAETLGTGAAGQFTKDFAGLKSIQGNGTAINTYLAFVDREASYNAGTGAGNGDYHLQDTSPALNMQRDWVLPYDIEGNPRLATDAAGAYSQHEPGGGSNMFLVF